MRSAYVLILLGAAFALFGVLWVTCSLVSGFHFPVAGYEAFNLPAGIALLVVGPVMAVRGWSLRARH